MDIYVLVPELTRGFHIISLHFSQKVTLAGSNQDNWNNFLLQQPTLTYPSFSQLLNTPTMSTPTIDKEVVRAAVCSAERFRYHVPFDTMEKAKEFVSTLCEANEFDYGLPVNTPEPTRRAVVDRVHFFVALNAYNRGEFVIPEMFPNPKKLREAVEADVGRVLRVITSWSRKFPSVRLAADFVAKECATHKFAYTPFKSVDTVKYQGFVHYNTVRQAYEAGKVSLTSTPKEWFKKVALKPGLTMRATIEADIDRLMPLLPPWPALASINAAQNHVSRFCARTKFQYTGWKEVEPHKYRMWVNYHTAKRAFDAGSIAMGPWAVIDEANRDTGGKLQKHHHYDNQEDEVDLYEDLMDFSDEPWFLPYSNTNSRSVRRGSVPLKALMGQLV
jgi:hypothetical protein